MFDFINKAMIMEGFVIMVYISVFIGSYLIIREKFSKGVKIIGISASIYIFANACYHYLPNIINYIK